MLLSSNAAPDAAQRSQTQNQHAIIFKSIRSATNLTATKMANGWYAPVPDISRQSTGGGWLAGAPNQPSYISGKVHLGVDFPADADIPVFAISEGKIIDIGNDPNSWGEGNHALVILHYTATGVPFVAIYGHIHIQAPLALGDLVSAGEQIGTIGALPKNSADGSGGSHLHFGIHPGSGIPDVVETPSSEARGWGRESTSWYAMLDSNGQHLTNGFVDPIAWLNSEAAVPTSSTVTITDSSPTPIPLPFIFAGESVRVIATLTTATDPNENSEGEALILASSGGFSQTVTTYNQPQEFSFTALHDGETLTATASGDDNDEYAVVSAEFGTTLAPAYSPSQKDAYQKLASDFGAEAVALGALSSSITSLPIVGSAYASIFNLSAALAALQSHSYAQLALDPPDPNYKVIAKLPREPRLSLPAGKTISASEAHAISAYQLNQEQAIALAAAASTTSDRASGALAAGDVKWEKKQLAVLAKYKKMEAALFKKQPGLLQKATTAISAAHFSTVTITQQDALNFEKNVLNNGIPTEITATLSKLGADSATIDTIRQLLFVQDTGAVAGSFPGDLARSSILSDLSQLGALLTK